MRISQLKTFWENNCLYADLQDLLLFKNHTTTPELATDSHGYTWIFCCGLKPLPTKYLDRIKTGLTGFLLFLKTRREQNAPARRYYKKLSMFILCGLFSLLSREHREKNKKIYVLFKNPSLHPISHM
jgi:hypothetical protein